MPSLRFFRHRCCLRRARRAGLRRGTPRKRVVAVVRSRRFFHRNGSRGWRLKRHRAEQRLPAPREKPVGERKPTATWRKSPRFGSQSVPSFGSRQRRRRRRRCAPPTTRQTLTAHQQAFKARLPHQAKRQRSNRGRANVRCKKGVRYQPGQETGRPPLERLASSLPLLRGGSLRELKISGCWDGALSGVRGVSAPVGAASYFPLRAHKLTLHLRPLRAGTAERGTRGSRGSSKLPPPQAKVV